jgi:preprotein translocase subunit SecD
MSTQDPAPGYARPVAPPELGYVPEGYQPPPANPRSRRLRWLWLALGVAALVALAAGTTAFVLLNGRWDGQPSKGDVAVTLRMLPPDSGEPSADSLDRTKQILLSRMTGAEITRPTVTAIGTDTLLVTAAPEDAERVKALLTPGNLTFRKVLASTPDQPGSPAAGCQGDPAERPDLEAALASAKAKLGAAFDAAGRITDPARADASVLAAFGTLTCAEVEALPTRMQYMVPTVTCAMLNGRVPGALDRATDAAVACDQKPSTKYMLDGAKVVGADLAGAEAKIDPQQGTWIVNLRFTSGGQPKWTALTQEVVADGQRTGQPAEVAIALDNQVLTAPVIQEVINGDAVISSNMDKQSATLLAANLTHGALPLRLVVASIETVR